MKSLFSVSFCVSVSSHLKLLSTFAPHLLWTQTTWSEGILGRSGKPTLLYGRGRGCLLGSQRWPAAVRRPKRRQRSYPYQIWLGRWCPYPKRLEGCIPVALQRKNKRRKTLASWRQANMNVVVSCSWTWLVPKILRWSEVVCFVIFYSSYILIYMLKWLTSTLWSSNLWYPCRLRKLEESLFSTPNSNRFPTDVQPCSHIHPPKTFTNDAVRDRVRNVPDRQLTRRGDLISRIGSIFSLSWKAPLSITR